MTGYLTEMPSVDCRESWACPGSEYHELMFNGAFHRTVTLYFR
jgi:hypothetical protein